MTTDKDLEPSDIYGALNRQPSRAWIVVIGLAALACIAWLGWCAVAIACAGFESAVGKACAEAGYTYTRGVCAPPEVRVHIDGMPKDSKGFTGPGGA